MKMTGSRALLECLKREGVDTIFGYPGGAVIPIYDTIYQFPDIQHILVRHEQGAGHMAEGYALATGKVGVCLATSGPGATNLVTPIADAMMDSVPLVAITGQVKTDRHRHRCLPGSGHHRHHHADHQAQLAGQGCHQAAGDHRRGVPHRPLGPARPGAGGHPRGHLHAPSSTTRPSKKSTSRPSSRPPKATRARSSAPPN